MNSCTSDAEKTNLETEMKQQGHRLKTNLPYRPKKVFAEGIAQKCPPGASGVIRAPSFLHPEAPTRHYWAIFSTDRSTFYGLEGQICFGSVVLLLHLCFEIGFFSVRSAGIRYDSFWLWIVSGGSKRCLLKREHGRAGLF